MLTKAKNTLAGTINVLRISRSCKKNIGKQTRHKKRRNFPHDKISITKITQKREHHEKGDRNATQENYNMRLSY